MRSAPVRPLVGYALSDPPSSFNADQQRYLGEEFRKVQAALNRTLVWNDMTIDGLATRTQGTSDPSLAVFNGGVYTFQFSATVMNQCFISFQLPHSWAEGTVIRPHVHWSPMTTNTGACRWGFEYVWTNYQDTAGATTTLYVDQAGDGTALKHQIAPFGDISGTGKKASSILVCRLFRDAANAADTYTGLAALLAVDIHYQIDQPGSYSEYVK